jgi:hypothetical protein
VTVLVPKGLVGSMAQIVDAFSGTIGQRVVAARDGVDFAVQAERAAIKAKQRRERWEELSKSLGMRRRLAENDPSYAGDAREQTSLMGHAATDQRQVPRLTAK